MNTSRHGSSRPSGKLACCSITRLCLTHCNPWTAACQASLSFTVSQSLPKLMSNESVMPSNHLILCHPLLLLPSIFPSIRLFSSESALHMRWPKDWSVTLVGAFVQTCEGLWLGSSVDLLQTMHLYALHTRAYGGFYLDAQGCLGYLQFQYIEDLRDSHMP